MTFLFRMWHVENIDETEENRSRKAFIEISVLFRIVPNNKCNKNRIKKSS